MNRQCLPEGVRDWAYQELERKKELISTIEKEFRAWGYKEIQTPLLEFYEVFQEERGSIEPQSMIKVIDRNGEILVLRPDMTPSIGRYVAGQPQGVLPDRLFSINTTYRYLKDHGEKQCEATRSSLEYIGNTNITADFEVIYLAVKTLKSLGLEDFRIDIGDVRYFKGLVQQCHLNEKEAKELEKMIESKNQQELQAFIEDKGLEEKEQNFIKKLPYLFGDESLLQMQTEGLNEMSLKAIKALQQISEYAEARGISKYIGYDLSMVCRLNYYTGTIFRGYTFGSGGPITHGGRYDQLVYNGKEWRPAVGFGIMIDEVLKVLADKGYMQMKRKSNNYLILFDQESYVKAMTKAEELNALEHSIVKMVELKEENNETEILTCNLASGEGDTQIIIVKNQEETWVENSSRKVSENNGEINTSISKGTDCQADTSSFWESRH